MSLPLGYVPVIENGIVCIGMSAMRRAAHDRQVRIERKLRLQSLRRRKLILLREKAARRG